MNQKNVSLKVKLIGLSLGITSVLGLSSFGILSYIAKTQEKTHFSSFEAYARNLGDAISAQFYERYGDVQAFAVSPAIQSPDKKVIVDMLNTWSALYGIYDLIMVVDAKGRLVAVNSKGPDGKDIASSSLYEKNYSDTTWFQSVMSGKTTDDKDKGFTGTYVDDVQVDPLASQVAGASRLGSSFSAAIKNSAGEPIGVVTNRAGSRWFEVAFKELLLGLKKVNFNNSQLQLISKDGTLLFEYKSNPDVETLDAPKYNFEELFKKNLVKLENPAAIAALSGRTSSVSFTKPGGTEEIIGYTAVQGPKFVNSLGWAVLVRDVRSEIAMDLNRAKNIFYACFACLLLVTSAISYWFASLLSTRLGEIAKRLATGSGEVSTAAHSILNSSVELSEAATEQAAAIQETAASIDEVSAMVKKSAENALQSQKVSEISRQGTEKGKEDVKAMMESIVEISQSNAQIMSQVEDGNRKISEIVKVIAEIGNKTKVINDIVFQTKLLSFNASVEAARAGEHGKGFAVVAEEVGNLAQMSGNAAKEISAMLDSSIQKVEGIVNETKSRVEGLVVENRAKVDVGTRMAEQCNESLGKILQSVQEVDGMVTEISSASSEQALGVSEINKAMNQLDQVTQKNTSVAQSAAHSSRSLNQEASGLSQVVNELLLIVDGHAPSNSGSLPADTSTESEAPTHAQVLPMRKKVKLTQTTFSGRSNMSAAVASSEALPSKDDPRFEDV